MESTTVLTKTTSKGQQVVVMMSRSAESYWYSATVDGALVVQGASGMRLPRPQGAITHVLSSGKVAVGLTATEWTTIETAREAAEAADRETAEGQTRTLRTRRERLVLEIRGLEDDADARKAAALDLGDDRYWMARADDESVIAAARVALANFDAAHPEVVEQLRRERDERATRNAWM